MMGFGRFGATFAVGLAVGVLAMVGPVLAACSANRVDLRGAFGTAGFSVELAATPSARAQGLMNRDSLPSSAGMLFVYDAPQRATFWMKNTRIPLDMIFLDATGRVLGVHANARPMDTNIIDGGLDVLAVLEINGGLAARLGITTGDMVRHPAFAPATAAWPCD